MNKPSLSMLFLGKAGDEHCARALRFCQDHCQSVVACFGQWGDPLPEAARGWQGDYIISYLSRWIVPEWLLRRARGAAINFHPASPDYPGIGCNNFALYEGAKFYGTTCHHMVPRVDEGEIIAVRRFPVFKADGVESLLARTYDHQIVLFYEIMSLLIEGRPLPRADEHWTRKPFTRRQFNELGRIRPEMSRQEIARRVRATHFGPWRPTVEIQGFVFALADSPEEPHVLGETQPVNARDEATPAASPPLPSHPFRLVG